MSEAVRSIRGMYTLEPAFFPDIILASIICVVNLVTINLVPYIVQRTDQCSATT